MELGPGAPENTIEARVSDNDRSVEKRFRVSSDSDSGGGYKEMDFNNGDKSGADYLTHRNDTLEFKDNNSGFRNDRFEVRNDWKEAAVDLLSEFDDYVANEKSGAMGMAATSRALSYGFEVGDMVWGKVKSHPWWPGHIFSEALASPSVRRTRREGHILVAFFGDSSYGWFDPAELIPFDINFEEKSQQTNSRTFLKAVEEAVDEASRRRGLGLACKCRNPYNFRVSSVQGYVIVDVPDFEPGTAYSWNQIEKARDSFKPNETLSFVKQLALEPLVGDEGSIDLLSNKGIFLAYRKSVFEEFDETYAEAFGVQPGRPTRDLVSVSDQPIKEPPRAPLSGPLVIAETLGVEKSASKPIKVKDHSKKDRYLFKRRDEPSSLKNHQINQGQGSSSAPAPLVGASAEIVAGDYVLQKRTPPGPVRPQLPAKHEQTGFISTDSEASNLGASIKDTETIKHTPVSNSLATQGVTAVAKGSLDKRKSVLHEAKGILGPDGGPRSLQQESESVIDYKHKESATTKSYGSDQQPEIGGVPRSDQVHATQSVPDLSPSVAKRSDGYTSIGPVKKAKVLKRPAGNMSSDSSPMGEKKKKKKKAIGSEASSDHIPKSFPTGKVGPSAGKLAVKSNQIGLDTKEDVRVEQQKKMVGASFGTGNAEYELPQLLSDLQALALDPFHGIERNCHRMVRPFFLRFRSLVYQKSLVLTSPSETERVKVRMPKSPVGINATTNNPPSDHAVKELTSSKPVKPSFGHDDPTKAGRKRLPSDRQEDIAAKKFKKINAIKSLSAEKKAGQKITEPQKAEEKDSVWIPVPPKLVKQDSFRKAEHSLPRTLDPTMLVMKFPPQTSLPSLAELKARFARFGPIDQSGLRVFWKSSTCRVVFLHKADARAAYKYAIGNNSLFGNVSVRYNLREVETPASDVPESGKSRGDDNFNETPVPKDPLILQRTAPNPGLQPLVQLPNVQIKSILKKSSGDEPGQGTGGTANSKTTPRVKFMLGGEEGKNTTREEQMMMVGNRNNYSSKNASFADDSGPSGAAPSSVAIDFNSNYFQKVVTTSPSPAILPTPPQFSKAPLSIENIHGSEMVPNTQNHNALNSTTIDISEQMLSLLTRCNEVVANVSDLLGYVPYHPL